MKHLFGVLALAAAMAFFAGGGGNAAFREPESICPINGAILAGGQIQLLPKSTVSQLAQESALCNAPEVRELLDQSILFVEIPTVKLYELIMFHGSEEDITENLDRHKDCTIRIFNVCSRTVDPNNINPYIPRKGPIPPTREEISRRVKERLQPYETGGSGHDS